GQRLEVVVPQPSAARLAEIAALPAGQLIYLKLAPSADALALRPRLAEAGFRFGGLLPDAGGGWLLLFLRGQRGDAIRFCDAGAEQLYRLDLQPAA
ncbi:hypothetical protein, partial [Chromobacterium subtsugae]